MTPRTCPRCGLPRLVDYGQELPEGMKYASLSKHEKTLICSDCGDEESVAAWIGAPEWDPMAWRGRWAQ